MFNKVVLLGRVANDLELKTTQSGVSVVSFSIACDRKYQTKGDERIADFFPCVAWRSNAEFICKYFAKGAPILIEGELQNRAYTDKNGNEQRVTEVIIDRATFTGAKKPSAETPADDSAETPADDSAETPVDGDYPF